MQYINIADAKAVSRSGAGVASGGRHAAPLESEAALDPHPMGIGSASPKSNDDVVAIRHAPAGFWIVLALLCLVAAVAFIFYDYGRFFRPTGEFRWQALSSRSAMGIIGLCGFALYFAFRALNNGVVIVMDVHGIRDRRLGPMLLPWSQIKRAAAFHHSPHSRSGYRAEISLHLAHKIKIRDWLIGEKSVSEVFILLRMMEIEPAQFVDHMRRFAPELEIDTSRLEITLVRNIALNSFPCVKVSLPIRRASASQRRREFLSCVASR